MNVLALLSRTVLLIALMASLLVACSPATVSPTAPGATPVPAATRSDAIPAETRDAASVATAMARDAATPTTAPNPVKVATTASGVPFEVLAQGSAMVSPSDAPVLQAVHGDDVARTVAAGLPDDAKAPLQQALARADSALYIVIALGKQPSSGYGVRITAITRRATTGGSEGLVVNYVFEKPDPAKGGATVMTYPFVVARVPNTTVRAADVTFQAQ